MLGTKILDLGANQGAQNCGEIEILGPMQKQVIVPLIFFSTFNHFYSRFLLTFQHIQNLDCPFPVSARYAVSRIQHGQK